MANVRPMKTFGSARHVRIADQSGRSRSQRTPRRRARARAAPRERSARCRPSGSRGRSGCSGWSGTVIAYAGPIAARIRSAGNVKSGPSGTSTTRAPTAGRSRRIHVEGRNHDDRFRERSCRGRRSAATVIARMPSSRPLVSTSCSVATPSRAGARSDDGVVVGIESDVVRVSARSASITFGEQPAVFSFRCSRSPVDGVSDFLVLVGHHRARSGDDRLPASESAGSRHAPGVPRRPRARCRPGRSAAARRR